MNYTGWGQDGKVMDTSVQRGEAIPIALAQINGGLKVALKLMKPGEIRQFWIPAKSFFEGEVPAGAPKGPFCFQFEFVELFEQK